ncbi:hypothetical protein SRHO_G00126510 [Serrasalmus rhombeus]
MVKYLMSTKGTIELASRHWCTPLHLAIKGKAVSAADCQLLHAWYLAGAYMDQVDYNGRIALHTAVRNKEPQMVAKLLQYDTISMAKDKRRQAAMDEATMNNLSSILTLINPDFTDIQHPERLVPPPGCDRRQLHIQTHRHQFIHTSVIRVFNLTGLDSSVVNFR